MNQEEQPKGYWVFSVRVGTTKVGTPTTKMKEKIANRVSKIAGVCEVEVDEDFSKDPLKHLKPLTLEEKENKGEG